MLARTWILCVTLSALGTDSRAAGQDMPPRKTSGIGMDAPLQRPRPDRLVHVPPEARQGPRPRPRHHDRGRRDPPLQARRRRRASGDGLHRHREGIRRLPPPRSSTAGASKKFQPRYALKRDAGLYYHILGPDAVWPRSLQYQVQQTDVGDLIALYGFQLDTWIDPKTRDDDDAHVPRTPTGGASPRARRQGDRLPEAAARATSRSTAGTRPRSSSKGDTTTHILNGQVVNRGKNVRFVDPENPSPATPLTRRPDRARDRGGRDRVPECGDQEPGRRLQPGKMRRNLMMRRLERLGSRTLLAVAVRW